MKSYLILFLIMVINHNSNSQTYSIQTIAQSNYQWTGIAISKSNRIFVNFPTWDVKSPYKVAELVNGKEIPYPSKKANKHFVCIQSVVIDKLDRLWILDPANPQFKGVEKTGAKLFLYDLKTNHLLREYKFPLTTAPTNSYLNDLRIDTERDIAYITDSKLGGIVVLDLKTGNSYRALDNSSPKLLANLDVIDFESTGIWSNKVHSDGIELSTDGNTLYFTALTANILYSIPTDVLQNTKLTAKQRAESIEIENENNVPTDGMLLVGSKLVMANLPNEGIWKYNLATGEGTTLELNEKIRWADSFAADTAGNIYFTCSQINYPINQRTKYKLVKLSRNY